VPVRPLTNKRSYWQRTRVYYWIVVGTATWDHDHYAELDTESADILREALAEQYAVSGVIPITRRQYLQHRED